jgi:hypothetical protein
MILLLGCQSDPTTPRSPQSETLFGPKTMRMHPIFTQLKDWSGGGKPDGIEAVVEFSDRFGDTTKAAGTLLFELFAYREAFPDHRGDRVVQPWIGEIITAPEQEAHWDRASRAYTFQLAWPQIHANRTYVLTATFEPIGGVDASTDNGQKRLFDQLVLTPAASEKATSEPSKLSDLFRSTTEPAAESPSPAGEPEPSADQPLSAPPLPPGMALPQLPTTSEPSSSPAPPPGPTDSTTNPTAPSPSIAPPPPAPLSPDATPPATPPSTIPDAIPPTTAPSTIPDAMPPATAPVTAPATQP